MARFTVLGVSRETGQDAQLAVEADSEANAKIKAELQGLAVSRVVPLDGVPYTADPAIAIASARASVKTPVLISAISNIVVGLFWLSTCFGAILTVPMIILCIFEFQLFSSADSLPDAELGARAKNLGIFQIVVGLFNIASLVCGIIVLVNAGKLETSPRPA